MKFNQIQLIILLLTLSFNAIMAQEADCVNCPNCLKSLKEGQALQAKTIDDMKEDHRRKMANLSSMSRSEVEKLKQDNAQLTSDNQSLTAQLADERLKVDDLAKKKAALDKQLQVKTAENEALDKALSDEKTKLIEANKTIENLNKGLFNPDAICKSDWIDDRIAPKSADKLIRFKGKRFKLYGGSGDNSSDIIVISFQDKSTEIKQIRIGEDVVTDANEINCIMRRVTNLFEHYQDQTYLRVSGKFVNSDYKGLAKERFDAIKGKFFKKLFDTDDKNAKKKAEGDGESSYKKFTISKIEKGSLEGVVISIASSED